MDGGLFEEGGGEIDELLNAWEDLQFLGEINENAAMMDFVRVDADVITG